MSKQRMIRDSFWTDSYIERLTPDEKLIFVYLLTNPLCNIAGMYEIRTKRIAFETGYDMEVVENILKRFERDGKIARFNDWLRIVNFVKNQSLNPSVEAGIARVLSELPSDVREAFGLVDITTDIKKRSTENFIAIKDEEKACRKCGDTDKLQVDHIVPLFAGGDNSKSNLQVLCHSCHQIKTQNDFTAYQNIGRTACSTLLNLTLPNSTTPNANAETVAEEDFTVFWKKYPKKVGKGAAEKSWSKHKPDLTKVLDAIEKQKQSAQWKENNGKYIPHPATWLNQKRWEDEIEITNNAFSKYDN